MIVARFTLEVVAEVKQVKPMRTLSNDQQASQTSLGIFFGLTFLATKKNMHHFFIAFL